MQIRFCSNFGKHRLVAVRPEKAHSLQVDILATLFAKYPEHKGSVKMFIIGGVRNAADQALVDHLKSKAAQASLSSHIEIIPNASVEVLSSYFSHARVGIHTMRNEHFGIGIVEYMAAGLVPLAHGTGGPLMDIVAPFEGESTGFLAETPDNYADMLHRILTMSQKDSLAMQRTARNSVLDRFSDTTFQRAFLALVQTLL